MQKLTRRDLAGLLLCVILSAAFLTIGLRYFEAAFPEASIDFRVDRVSSQRIAEGFLAGRGVSVSGYKHSVEFAHDEPAKIFLERKLGLRAANALMRRDVKVWSWRHRWFRPLQREEYVVEIAPTGELVSFQHVVADESPAPVPSSATALAVANAFLQKNGIAPASLRYLGASERELPKRRELSLSYEASTLRPAGAPYRFTVTIRGNSVEAFRQELKVPEQWSRDYAELRSKNSAAGAVDEVFLLGTLLAALVIFIRRLRLRAIDIRFALGAGGIAFVLVVLSGLNSLPSALASYDTNSSFSAFVGQQILSAILGGFVSGIVLMVIVGAGEALYRERFPQHLSIPRLLSRRSLRSKRVFFGFVIGLTLFAGFLAYQVVFYLVASRFGAWSPADVPYDEILSTRFPWLAVLFMGFYPAMSEEFLSRAFSIPFFERLLRSRVAAIVISGFIWGFGHAAYPNQPFFIRGVEVGIAGVIIGSLLLRFGLLPLLVWHYTVDALYTAIILMRSGNLYYTVSAAAASLVFVVPIVISLILYFRRGGFEGDEGLENGVTPAEAAAGESTDEELPHVAAEPPPVIVSAVSPFSWRAALILLAIGLASLALRKNSPMKVVDYRITADEAISVARKHLVTLGVKTIPPRAVAAPAGGFRRWDAPDDASAAPGDEEGGGPTGYDTVAAEYILRHAPVERLAEIERQKVHAATWAVRFYQPRQRDEYRVEVDPRTSRVLGIHHVVQESQAGARLEEPQAEALARRELPRYALDPQRYLTKEALRFEQPARRDWLFHFQERSALVAEAYQRVDVRVSGDAVTQVTRTVKIPESEARRATQQTLLNIILTIAKIAGAIGLMALTINGTLAGARLRPFAWRQGLRVAMWSSPLAIAAAATRATTFSYDYSTSIAWSTFVVLSSVKFVVLVVAWLTFLFLAVAMLLTAYPAALAVLRDRAALARDSFVRTVAAGGAALAAGSLFAVLSRLLQAHWPARAVDPSIGVGIPAPSITSLWMISMIVSFILAFAACVRASTIRHAPLVAAVSIFLVSLSASITPDQLPATVISALTAAVVFYIVGARITAPNPLAVLTASLGLAGAVECADLMRNHRLDLQLNGAIVAAVVGGLLLYLWRAAIRPLPE